ncbi:asparagine synthase-related protein [Methylobacterium oryzae CBMB20]
MLKEAARAVVPAAVIDRKKGYFPRSRPEAHPRPVPRLRPRRPGPARGARRGIFDRAYVDHLLADPDGTLTPKGNSKLWQVALLESWLQTHGV